MSRGLPPRTDRAQRFWHGVTSTRGPLNPADGGWKTSWWAACPDSLFMLFPRTRRLVEAAPKWIADRVGLGNVMNPPPADAALRPDLRRLELAKAIARDPKSGAGRTSPSPA